MPGDVTTERLLRELTWEWQDVEDLMEKLIPVVPPGKAKRTYESRQGKHVKGTGRRPPLTEDEQQASGARAIVNDRLAAQVDGGRIEVERDEEGRRRVRFRERREVADERGCCPTCNRPFEKATVEKPQPPSRPKARPKVVYPNFKQWSARHDRSSG